MGISLGTFRLPEPPNVRGLFEDLLSAQENIINQPVDLKPLLGSVLSGRERLVTQQAQIGQEIAPVVRRALSRLPGFRAARTLATGRTPARDFGRFFRLATGAQGLGRISSREVAGGRLRDINIAFRPQTQALSRALSGAFLGAAGLGRAPGFDLGQLGGLFLRQAQFGAQLMANLERTRNIAQLVELMMRRTPGNFTTDILPRFL